MGIQDRVVKMAMNSALESLNDNMPQMKLLLDNYKVWKHSDLLKLKAVIEDIANMLEGVNIPIKPDTIRVMGTVALINADMNEQSYGKVKKLFDDLKSVLKD